MRTTELPADERPRERLISLGAESLSLTELLAIVLGSGVGGKGAVELAQNLISIFGSADNLAKASVEKIASIRGIGIAKACRIRAAIELGKRIIKSNRMPTSKIKSPEDVADLVMDDMKHLDREHFKVILLDSKNAVVGIQTVSIGTVDSSLVHPREVLKPALEKSASAIILVHNHPSGSVSPSKEDILVTERFVRCCDILGIEILDHIIVGYQGYKSLRESGYL
ncbi:MAG: RadC family protein [bacterium]